MILRRDCSVLSLLGMGKPDESSHLVKEIPAWRITAQGDVQNLPTLITLLLAASAMDLSPNCMIPFILNGFIPASPCASSCAAAWHQNGRRLRAAPGHHNKIRLLTELCCIMACDEYPGGKKFKLILCCLVSPFWNSRTSHRLLSPNTKCKTWEQLQYAVIRRGDLLWNFGWGFECFSLHCFFVIREYNHPCWAPFCELFWAAVIGETVEHSEVSGDGLWDGLSSCCMLPRCARLWQSPLTWTYLHSLKVTWQTFQEDVLLPELRVYLGDWATSSCGSPIPFALSEIYRVHQ